MSKLVSLTIVFLAGLALGGFFFGGLYVTVSIGLTSKHPALLFFGSLVIRMVVFLGVMYIVADGHWERFLVITAGFLIARIIVTRYTRTLAHQKVLTKEAGDAS